MFGRLDRCIIQRSCLYHLLGIPITQRTALVDSCLVSILRFSQVLRGQFVGLNSHCFSLSLERRAKRDSPSNLLRFFDFDEEWTQPQRRDQRFDPMASPSLRVCSVDYVINAVFTLDVSLIE